MEKILYLPAIVFGSHQYFSNNLQQDPRDKQHPARLFQLLLDVLPFVQNITLKLHQHIVDRGATIHSQFFNGYTRIRFHCFQYISGLVSDAFQCGSCDMRLSGSSCKSENRSPRMLVPVWCAKPAKAGTI